MDTKKYITIKIPKETGDKIDQLIDDPGSFYRSRTDFLFCAIREYINLHHGGV